MPRNPQMFVKKEENIQAEQRLATSPWKVSDTKTLLTGKYPSLDLGKIRKMIGNEMWQNTSTEAKRRVVRPVWTRIDNWIVEYQKKGRFPGAGYLAFRSDWLELRSLVSLQIRLVVEAVLWEKGKPWSQLVTGFRPFGKAGERYR